MLDNIRWDNVSLFTRKSLRHISDGFIGLIGINCVDQSTHGPLIPFSHTLIKPWQFITKLRHEVFVDRLTCMRESLTFEFVPSGRLNMSPRRCCWNIHSPPISKPRCLQCQWTAHPNSAALPHT